MLFTIHHKTTTERGKLDRTCLATTTQVAFSSSIEIGRNGLQLVERRVFDRLHASLGFPASDSSRALGDAMTAICFWSIASVELE